MSIRLTKNELRSQQVRLSQLQRYLPTLQLKKAMLQFEVSQAVAEVIERQTAVQKQIQEMARFASFLSDMVPLDYEKCAEIVCVEKEYENIAGVEIPLFKQVVFKEVDYFLYDTPVYAEQVIAMLRDLVVEREKLNIASEKLYALEKELKEVSIRVNLFEKILIPRSRSNIKKIRIFLGDQQLSSVAQAKVAKRKILLKQEAR